MMVFVAVNVVSTEEEAAECNLSARFLSLLLLLIPEASVVVPEEVLPAVLVGRLVVVVDVATVAEEDTASLYRSLRDSLAAPITTVGMLRGVVATE